MVTRKPGAWKPILSPRELVLLEAFSRAVAEVGESVETIQVGRAVGALSGENWIYQHATALRDAGLLERTRFTKHRPTPEGERELVRAKRFYRALATKVTIEDGRENLLPPDAESGGVG